MPAAFSFGKLKEEEKKVTEKRDDMICEICGHTMTYEEQIRVFTCGPFDYHAKALMYQCSCCGYEKLGTCMVQFWENDTPSESLSECMKEQIVDSEMETQDRTIDTEEEYITETESLVVNKLGFFERVKSFFRQWAKIGEGQIPGTNHEGVKESITTTESHNSTAWSEPTEQKQSIQDSITEKEMVMDDSGPQISKKDPEEKKIQSEKEIKESESEIQIEQEEPQQNIRPTLYETIDGKRRISDAWMDYMLEHSIWYPWWYNHFVSAERKTDRYLKSHTPACQIIRNDILYDTQTAKMYLAVEKTSSGKGKRKIYNYVTPAKKYFSITVMMGRPDDLTIMEEKDVKKLLAEYPDIYREVINSDIIE